jgi:exopolysaccharide biosynthesis polyprenyl glycosylphosphotransferase
VSVLAPSQLPLPKRPLAPASRVIPGARYSASGIPRKKVMPVALGGRLWAGGQAASQEAQPRQSVSEEVARMLLPGLFLRNDAGRLASNVLADFVAVALSFAVATNLAGMLGLMFRATRWAFAGSFASVSGMMLLQAFVLTLVGHSERLYHRDVVRCAREEQLILLKAATWSAILMVAANRCPGVRVVPSGVLIASAVFSFLLMTIWRHGWRRVAKRHTHSRHAERNVLIVGAGKLGRQLAAGLEDCSSGQVVRGFLDDNVGVGGDIRGRIEDLSRVARTEFLDEVIIALPYPHDLTLPLIREAQRNHLDVKVVPDFSGFQCDRVALETVGNIPVLTLRQERIPRCSLMLKRVVDAAFSATGLMIIMPLMAAAALVVKVDSQGPIFYRSLRVGRRGRRFVCYKLRTMVSNAESLKGDLRARNQRRGAFFKIVDDPRITRAGRWLRRYSLDELPQLWNVLKGEMSLVGPRPHPLDDFDRYELDDWRRLAMTPGLTGLWQVTARRDPSFERNMALDLEYILGWSLWRDLVILCKTVPVVLRGSGA